jgi:DNA-binding response OmpR family regulator
VAESKKRILIVEDDAAIRTMEDRILTASGFEVSTAPGGPQGIELAKATTFHLYILDVMMPGMNGFELARHLRSEDNGRVTPILFVTARGEPDAMTEGFSAGASLYLVKPFTTTTLLTMVRGALATVQVDAVG